MNESVSDRLEMGRSAGILYWAGGGIVALTVALPHGLAPDYAAMAILTAIALASGTLFYFWGERLPIWLFNAFTVLASCLVAGLVSFGGDDGRTYILLYLWIALYSCYFYTGKQSVLQCSAIATTMAAVELAAPPSLHAAPSSYVEWMIVVATAAIAGAMIFRLVRRVRETAFRDALTGLPNRRAWDAELERAHRQRVSGCVAILDLDNFKIVNDEQGHRAGDRLLADAARIWSRGLPPSTFMARYGGEEFGLVIRAVDEQGGRRAVEALRSVTPGGVTCSAGFATFAPGELPESVFARADAALRTAKREGRNRTVAAGAPAANGSTPQHWSGWTQRVAGVLAGGRVDAVFQPVVDLATLRILGFEALARIPGRSDGVDLLFEAALRMGMARELDALCLRAAVQASAELPHRVPLFVNLTVASILEPADPVADLVHAVTSGGLDPAEVIFELTERETVLDLVRTRAVVQDLRAVGFRVALDDVGHGRVGLDVLAAVRPEFIKLDRRFTANISDAGVRAAVAGTLAIARAAGGLVIAEGIETGAALHAVLDAGVTSGQGFRFGAPRTAREWSERTVASLAGGRAEAV